MKSPVTVVPVLGVKVTRFLFNPKVGSVMLWLIWIFGLFAIPSAVLLMMFRLSILTVESIVPAAVNVCLKVNALVEAVLVAPWTAPPGVNDSWLKEEPVAP